MDSTQSSSNKCKNYLLKIYSWDGNYAQVLLPNFWCELLEKRSVHISVEQESYSNPMLRYQKMNSFGTSENDFWASTG